ncbi:MAG: MBL fold metallo-hydrolase [Bacilli bacterium]
MQKLIKLSEVIVYLPPCQETDRPILGAIVGSDRTLLIDAGNSSNHARQFREELSAIDVKGDWLAITHHHWDHVFGIKEVGLPTISHSMTRQKIAEMQELSWTDNACRQTTLVSGQTVMALARRHQCSSRMQVLLGEETYIAPVASCAKRWTPQGRNICLRSAQTILFSG